MFCLRESSTTVIERGMTLEPQRLGLQKYAFGDFFPAASEDDFNKCAAWWRHLEGE